MCANVKHEYIHMYQRDSSNIVRTSYEIWKLKEHIPPPKIYSDVNESDPHKFINSMVLYNNNPAKNILN